MDNKKLRMLDKLTRYVRKYMLASTNTFDYYPNSNIGEIIIGMIERSKDDNYFFACNNDELSGNIDDFDFKDGNKVYLSVNGYDMDLYLIRLAYIDLNSSYK